MSDAEGSVEAARLLNLREAFEARYGRPPLFISRGPGRVNVIGEHTDYNGGFVFPAAINRSVLLAVAPNGTADEVRLFSQDYSRESRFSWSQLEPAPKEEHWTDYVRGVAWACQERGLLDLSKLPGVNLLLASDVPQGAGLSSSAALEIATGLALFRLAGVGPGQVDRKALALACQRAENGFVGANTGIMDQFISALGQPDSALLIDTRSLDYRAVPLGFARLGLKLVAVDSAVPHHHDASGYNQRRAESEEAARFLTAAYSRSEGSQLRDFTPDQLAAVAAQMPELPARRARHVITEDVRTLRAVELLEGGFQGPDDLAEFGQLLRGSHESLRDDFQVTVPQVDRLAELAWACPGVVGARMTGGGFGGCTVNIVSSEALAVFERQVVETYRRETGLNARMFVFDAVEGGSLFDAG